jgi:hypothetical protein
MQREDVWFTITKSPGQRRMTPRNAKGVLIFAGTLLLCILPLVATVLLVVFMPHLWWLIPVYLVWAAVLILNLVRVVRGHSEVIDMNEAIAALREKQDGRRA